jgi:hypothetical protein
MRDHGGPRGAKLSEGSVRGRLGLLWSSGGHMKLRGPAKGRGGSLAAVGGCREPWGAARGHMGAVRDCCAPFISFWSPFFHNEIVT